MPRKRRSAKARRVVTNLSPAVRSFLLTGEDPIGLEGHYQWFQLLYGPFGSTREECAAWDPAAALEPYREALRDEGLTPIYIPDIDDASESPTVN